MPIKPFAKSSQTEGRAVHAVAPLTLKVRQHQEPERAPDKGPQSQRSEEEGREQCVYSEVFPKGNSRGGEIEKHM